MQQSGSGQTPVRYDSRLLVAVQPTGAKRWGRSFRYFICPTVCQRTYGTVGNRNTRAILHRRTTAWMQDVGPGTPKLVCLPCSPSASAHYKVNQMHRFKSYPRVLPWAVALAVGTLSACGGGRDPVLGTGSNVGMAPAVTSASPLPGASLVPLNTKKLIAGFSKAMDGSTLTASSFTLACPTGTPVSGVVGYDATARLATLTLPSTSNLPPSVLCTATVSTAAKDSLGFALASNYVWTFTTGVTGDLTAPTVTGTIHANGATGVPTNARVGATFSEAVDPSSINAATFGVQQGATVVAGTVSSSGANAVFIPTTALTANTTYTANLTTGAMDLAGNALASPYVWSWTTGATADTTAPTVSLVYPADNATQVATSSAPSATFSEAMDASSINAANFTVAGVSGQVGFNAQSQVATFTPSSPLANNTTYTATLKGGTGGVQDIAGNPLAVDKVWRFTTAAVTLLQPSINLGSAAPFGTFGGSAGMTNTGITTQINGDIGTIATGTSSIQGFHDKNGDIYTETLANIGAVNGTIFTCTNSVTGPTAAGPNAAACAVATQARLDAQTAYLALVAMPPGANPGANLANLTLAPGVYTAPSGSFMVEGGDLTLDAQGNANAVWVFQMATTLTVGGPGAAFPQRIVLAGGAQAKNIYWQVGSFATINAAGGGSMSGTIITQTGAAFSTVGNTVPVTLNGRILSLGASVTLVDTFINVPAP